MVSRLLSSTFSRLPKPTVGPFIVLAVVMLLALVPQVAGAGTATETNGAGGGSTQVNGVFSWVGVSVTLVGGGTASPAPTGTVTISDGTGASCVITLPGTSCSYTNLTAGAKSVTASYSGDGTYDASSSYASYTVSKANTTVTLTSSANPSVQNGLVTFTATIAESPSGPTNPTGTVSFYDGGALLGSDAVSANVATFATSTLGTGTHSITANYGGDGNFNGHVSSALSQAVTPLVDLKVYATAPSEVLAGETMTLSARVVNSGVNAAAGVVLTVTLPAEATYLADTAGCSEAGGVVTCALGTMASGESQEVEINALIPADTVAAEPDGTIGIATTFTVTTSYAEISPGDNTTTLGTIVRDSADLRVTKVSTPADVVRAGQTFRYTIFVDNLGPSASRDVTIYDTMISQGLVTPTGCSMSVPLPTGITSFNCDFTARSGLWALADFGADKLMPFSPTNTGRVTIGITATAGASINFSTISNEARAAASTPDPDMSNNFVIDPLAVEMVADLAITDTALAPTTVDAGDQACWQIVVTNNGPSSAENVRLTDLLPGGLVDGSITVDTTGCTLGTPGDPADPLICDLGTMATAATKTVEICGDVNPAFLLSQPDSPNASNLDNDARVTSDTFDPANGNNRATALVAVNGSADLSLRKFAVGTPTAGGEIHYEYQIANAGPAVSADVTLRDFLPSQVDFVSALVDYENGLGMVPLACGVTAGSNVLFCPLGDIPLTGTEPIMVFVNVRIKPDATGTITNSADLNLHDTPDPNPANNSATVTVTLRYSASLTITKTAVATSLTPGGENRPGTVVATPGGTLTYRLDVTNDGPSTAYNAVVTDPLNAELTYLSSSSAVCSLVAGVVTCSLGEMQPGETQSFEVTVAVASNPGGPTLANTACVAWQLGNATNLRACDSEIVAVAGLSDLRVRSFGKPDGEVRTGETFIYTIMVDNLGPSAAGLVTVRDELRGDGIFDIMGILPDATGQYDGHVTCTIDAPTSSAPVNPIVTSLPLGLPYVPGDVPTAPDIDQRATVTCILDLADGTVLPVLGPPADPDDPDTYNQGRMIIEIAVQARTGVSLDNCVDVTSLSTDPDVSNNSACTEHELTEVADLAVTKTAMGDNGGCGDLVSQADSVTAGNALTYTITVTNNGPNAAENVTLYDRLPAGVTVTKVAMAPGPGSCTTGEPGSVTDRLTCGLGSLAPDASVVVTVTVRVDPGVSDGTLLENDAVVTSDMFDNNNSNNYASQLTTVNAVADLHIAKMGPYDMAAGTTESFVVHVGNNGPSTARMVMLADIVPPGMRIVSAEIISGVAAGSSCAVQDLYSFDPFNLKYNPSNAVTCDLGDLPPGPAGDTDVTVRVHAESDIPGDTDLTNYAYVFSGAIYGAEYTADCDYANNYSEYTTTILTMADLGITSTAEPVKAKAGEQIKYTVRVENAGPSAAGDVTVVYTLPLAMDYEIDTAHCTLSGTDPDILTCDLDDMDSGQVREFVIWGKVHGDVAPGTILTTTATVAGETILGDPNLDDNSAATDILVTSNEVADLALAKAVTAEEQQVNQAGLMFNNAIPGQAFPTAPNYFASTRLTAGRRILYTLTVTNNGPGAAQNVVLSDRLPAGVRIYQGSLTAPGGVNCVTGTPGQPLDRMTCGLGTMAIGSAKSISFQVLTDASLAAGTILENDAQVTSDIFDNVNGNDYANTQTTVLAAADMRVALNAAAQVAPGQVLRYAVTVQNNGPSDSRSVTVQATLPPVDQVEYQSADGATCRADGAQANVQHCLLGDMQAGERKTFDIYVRVSPAATTLAQMCALVLSNPSNTSPPGPPPQPPTGGSTGQLTWDPVTSDNQACASVTLTTAVADLSLMLAAEPQKISAGEQARYTLRVENEGPSAATGVTVNATLPLDMDYEIDTGHCLLSGTDPDTLTCTLGLLQAGEAREFVIWARVHPDVLPGSILETTAVVAAGAGTTDPDAANDTAAADILAIGKADLKVLVFGTPQDTVATGEVLTYTIVADNLGSGWAHDVVVGDLLTSQGTFEIVSVNSDRPAVCAPLPGIYPGSVQLTCRLTDPLEVMTPSESGRWKITIAVTAAEPLDLNSVVDVVGSDPDPDMANNAATVNYSFESAADLSLAASAPGNVYPGDGITLTLTVVNNGPSQADGVQVQSSLPAGVTLQEATVAGGPGSCVGSEPLICGLGSIAAGESRTIQVEVTTEPGLTPGASLHFSAQVASDVNDDDLGNNFASAYVRIDSALLFADDFSDGGTTGGDPDWDTITGLWRVSDGKVMRARGTGRNLAVVNDPAVGSLAAGSLGTDLKFTPTFAANPNGSIVFGYQDSTHYRYVKVVKTGYWSRIQIGQVGDYAGGSTGIKAKGAARFAIGTWYHLRVDLHPDGWVRVYKDDRTTPSVSHRFPSPVAGQVGYRAFKSETCFDNFAAWYEGVLP